MERSSFAGMECPIARAVDEVGEGWTLLVLREAYKGAETFSDFQNRLPITPTTLTRRLETLTSRGFFVRNTYQAHPPRDRYELTQKALELVPVMVALGVWGNRWLAPEGDLITVVDAESGKPIDVDVVDRGTSRPVRAGRVALAPGPGARKPTRERLTPPVRFGRPVKGSKS